MGYRVVYTYGVGNSADINHKEFGMPNHVSNYVSIKGDEKKIAELKATAFDADGCINFEKILPPPENMFRGDLGEDERKQCIKDGVPNWYDWNVANWGTKWNAYCGSIIKDTLDAIHIKFDTAWSAPMGVFAKLEDMGFKLTGLWIDEGMCERNVIGEDEGYWCTTTEVELCL